MDQINNSFDVDLDIVLAMIDESVVPHVQVKGCEFFPDSERDLTLLTMLALHGDTRVEIEGLRDMLNDCLERSTPNREAAA